MRLIARRTLREYWESHPQARRGLEAWHADACRANWTCPMDIMKEFRNASILADDRFVFNIHGNRFRVIVKIQFEFGIVFIRFVGSHAEYDRIDAKKI